MKLTKTRLREIIEEEIASLTLEVAPLPVKRPPLGDVPTQFGREHSARHGAFSRKPRLTGKQENMLSTLGHRLASGGSFHWEDIGTLTAFYETQNKALPKEIDRDEIIAFLMNYRAFRDSYAQGGDDQRDEEDREYS